MNRAEAIAIFERVRAGEYGGPQAMEALDFALGVLRQQEAPFRASETRVLEAVRILVREANIPTGREGSWPFEAATEEVRAAGESWLEAERKAEKAKAQITQPQTEATR